MSMRQLKRIVLISLLASLGVSTAGAVEYSTLGGRIIKSWSGIEKERDLSKFLQRIELLDELGAKLEPIQERHSKSRKVLREVAELHGSQLKNAPYGDNFLFLFNLVTFSFKTKVPEQALDNPKFIYHFGNFLKRLWYAAARDTCNIAEFAPEFVNRVNEITRPHYVEFACTKKKPAVSPEVHPACPEASNYTCGRGVVSDCTALDDHKRPRILLLGTYSEYDDDVDVRQLEAFKLEATDVFSCQKAIKTNQISK